MPIEEYSISLTGRYFCKKCVYDCIPTEGSGSFGCVIVVVVDDLAAANDESDLIESVVACFDGGTEVVILALLWGTISRLKLCSPR
mmetsp:Transcript_26991/g.39764  ORF Transcript_26991/g.39764 Transcript_26991/m.39764 type:complete len:86 (-) Transcript_26991:40-297(-)